MTILRSTLAGFDTSYVCPPEESKQDGVCPGRIESLEYTTQNYVRGDGILFKKKCYIYVPHTYDRCQAYDIVYFMHGASGNATVMIGGEGQLSDTSRMLDYVIAKGETKPMLVVFSSYYEKHGDIDDIIGYDNAVKLQEVYYKEFINDLMPAVESVYSTYAKSVSAEDLKASREHRFLSGYSAGGSVTWYEFDHTIDYAKWYLNFSGTYKASANGKQASPKEIACHLEDTIHGFFEAGYQKTDFYLYITIGDETDKNYVKITSTFKAMMEQNKHSGIYSYGSDFNVNNLCFCVSNHAHCGEAIVPHLYNALRTVLKK